MSAEDLDSEFWDIGEREPQKSKKKQLSRDSSIFPSLSVYLSCQEESEKDGAGKYSSLTNNNHQPTIEETPSSGEEQSFPRENQNEEIHKGSEDSQSGSEDISSSEGSENQNDSGEQKSSIEVSGNHNPEELCSSEDSEDLNGYGESSDETTQEESDDPKITENRSPEEEGSFLSADNNIQTETPLRSSAEVDVLFFDNSQQKYASQFHKEKSFENSEGHNTEDQSVKNSLSCTLVAPRQHLKFWLHRGRKLLSSGDGALAVDAFVRSYALARLVHGDNHWRLARCKVFLARTYLYLLNLAPQAQTHVTEAIDIIYAELPTSIKMNKKPQIHHTVAWAFLIQGECKLGPNFNQSAETPFSRALLHARKFHSQVANRKQLKPSMQIDHPLDLIIKIFRAQAKHYHQSNNLNKAKGKLEESLLLIDKWKNNEREKHLVAPILRDLGDLILRHPKELGGGEESLRKEGFHLLFLSLQKFQENGRPGSMEECEVRFLIVQHQITYKRKETKDIQRELTKLKILVTRSQGEFGLLARSIQDCLIQLLLKEGLYSEAITELQSLLKTCRDYNGDYNGQVCNILRKLSNAYLMINNITDSLTILEHCLIVESFLYGLSSRRVRTLQLKIKDLLHQVPHPVKRKILKKHPELQQKPPFVSYC